MSSVIALSDVTKVYPGDVRALDAATFTVEEGEHCCLLGPNGAGKTTIIRLLQGAIRPTAGTLTILGAHAEGRALLEAKKHIGIVPQNPGLYPDLTVSEYLEFVRALYGQGSVVETARSCGLGDLMDRTLSSLSGGYQRRLLVGAALMSEPSLLLLDEPTVGLDPLAAADTRRLLKQAMQGRTVLMSTHNLAEAEELCNTVIIVRHGRVLVHERIDELRKEAAPRVHVVARQGAERLGRFLDTMSIPWSPNDAGVWLHLGDPERAVPDVLRQMLAGGFDVYECRLVSPSLEDLFVDVVTRT
ncbi:MAG: ABC transporter ATP-binding protein [Chloroflexota bacterium]